MTPMIVRVRPATLQESQAMHVWGQRALEACRAHNAGTLDPTGPPAFVTIFSLANQMLPTGHMIAFGTPGLPVPESVIGPTYGTSLMGPMMALAITAAELLAQHTKAPQFANLQMADNQRIDLVNKYDEDVLDRLELAVNHFGQCLPEMPLPPDNNEQGAGRGPFENIEGPGRDWREEADDIIAENRQAQELHRQIDPTGPPQAKG